MSQLHDIDIGTNADGKPFTLPSSAVTQTFAALARRGAGKTYLASVMAEGMLEADLQVVWLDPVGVAWGLRADGKRKGYQVLILGGEHRDAPLDPASGKYLAEFTVAERVPLILDVSEFSEADMRRFVADYLLTLYHKNRHPLHLFLDEADEWAPQTGYGPEQAKVLHATQQVVRRGRARGLGVTLISQRPAVLNKSVLTQAEVLVLLQITGPHDQAAAESWIQYHGTKEERERIMTSLPKLQRGQCWVYSPGWLRTLSQVSVRERWTFDSSRTPEVGEATPRPKGIAEIDLEKLSKRMQDAIATARSKDPAELLKRIRGLEAELAGAGQATHNPKIDQTAIAAAVDRAVHQNDRLWRVEMEKISRHLGTVNRALKQASEAWASAAVLLTGPIKPPPGRMDPSSQPVARPPASSVRAAMVVGARPSVSPASGRDTDIRLPIGERKVLTACAQYPDGVTREQLTVLTGYKRSSRDAYIQRLREKDLVEPCGAELVATPQGLAALGSGFEPLPMGQALQEYWLNRLPIGERAILDLLIAAYPNAVTREELSERTDYKRSSRDAYLQRMQAKRLFRLAKAAGDFSGYPPPGVLSHA